MSGGIRRLAARKDAHDADDGVGQQGVDDDGQHRRELEDAAPALRLRKDALEECHERRGDAVDQAGEASVGVGGQQLQDGAGSDQRLDEAADELHDLARTIYGRDRRRPISRWVVGV